MSEISRSQRNPSLVERLKDNELTNAMREILIRAPRGVSRAGQLARDDTPDADPADVKRMKYPSGTVPALANSLMVISYINQRAPEPVTLAEIASTLHITKSHCHSILRTLVYFEWLGFNDRFKTYHLLPSVLSDISSLFTSHEMEVLREALSELVVEGGLPLVLSQPLDDGSFVVIETFRSPTLMQVFYPVGYRFPRGAAAITKALLAWSGPEDVERYFELWEPANFTKFTSRTAEELRMDLEKTRDRGYALSVNEFTDDMSAIALPIFDKSGSVSYLVSCSYLTSGGHFDETEIARRMRATVDRVHRSILSKPPYGF